MGFFPLFFFLFQLSTMNQKQMDMSHPDHCVFLTTSIDQIYLMARNQLAHSWFPRAYLQISVIDGAYIPALLTADRYTKPHLFPFYLTYIYTYRASLSLILSQLINFFFDISFVPLRVVPTRMPAGCYISFMRSTIDVEYLP